VEILCNGKPQVVEEGATVASLVAELNLKGVAVEVNEEIVPREQHEGCVLSEGDRVEIVTLVGGG